MFKTVILVGAMLNVVACTNSSPEKKLAQPNGLLTELLRWPERAVITDATPELSWEVPVSVGNQTAYRILVASSDNNLKTCSQTPVLHQRVCLV